jgi:hypothetical protein
MEVVIMGRVTIGHLCGLLLFAVGIIAIDYMAVSIVPHLGWGRWGLGLPAALFFSEMAGGAALLHRRS